ncbi:MAG: DUF4132 domain-containing protein, partial [Pseudomonadota bacterium]
LVLERYRAIDRAKHYSYPKTGFLPLNDLTALLEAAAPDIQAALPGFSAKTRELALATLSRAAPTVPFLREMLLDAALSGSTRMRRTARASLARDLPEAMRTLARDHLASQRKAERLAAIEMLVMLAAPDDRAWLAARRDVENDATLLRLIDAEVQAPLCSDVEGPAYLAADDTMVAIPPVPPLPERPACWPLDTAALDELDALLTTLRAQSEARAARMIELRGTHTAAAKDFGYDMYTRAAVIAWAEKGGAGMPVIERPAGLPGTSSGELRLLLDALLASGWIERRVAGMTASARLWAALTRDQTWYIIKDGASQISSGLRAAVIDYLTDDSGDLRVLDAMECRQLEACGVGPNPKRSTIIELIKTRSAHKNQIRRDALSPAANFAPTTIWPALAEQLEALAARFKPTVKLLAYEQVHLLGYLATLPKLPAAVLPPIYALAAAPQKRARAEARRLLAGLPDLESRLLASLNAKQAEERAGAADWLCELDVPAARAAIQKRLKKEKADIARVAMIEALARLGADMSPYLSAEVLTADARDGMPKASLEGLEFLAIDRPMALRWKDGRPVEPDVIRWWIASAVKAKAAGGGRIFDLYLAQLDPEDAGRLSLHVLDCWIGHDLRGPTAAQEAEVAYMLKNYGFTSTLNNNATAERGLLALASRAPAALVAERVRRYVKQHGKRFPQSIALLEMLAARSEPVALAVLVGFATRTKQKGIQKRAGELIAAIAEEKGWTADELADRTVPTAGFDAEGVMELAVGASGKIYRARLDDLAGVTLESPAGNSVKALPAGDDDATKEAKKTLSAAKKEMKATVAQQAVRYYEAMCAGRAWTPMAFRDDLMAHPVMGRLARRIVWLALDSDGTVAASFRPTPEGDFTDVDDAEVDISVATAFRLAHGALVGAELSAAWVAHFEDYEIVPLFQQFERPLFRVEPDDSRTEIDDRRGWVTENLPLRGAVSKRGWTRGEVMDGGGFYSYVKSFGPDAPRAVLNHSGDGVGLDETMTIAIQALHFERAGGGGRRLRLCEVPPVMLSEAWADYRDIASKGAFDPEWQKVGP